MSGAIEALIFSVIGGLFSLLPAHVRRPLLAGLIAAAAAYVLVSLTIFVLPSEIVTSPRRWLFLVVRPLIEESVRTLLVFAIVARVAHCATRQGWILLSVGYGILETSARLADLILSLSDKPPLSLLEIAVLAVAAIVPFALNFFLTIFALVIKNARVGAGLALLLLLVSHALHSASLLILPPSQSNELLIALDLCRISVLALLTCHLFGFYRAAGDESAGP